MTSITDKTAPGVLFGVAEGLRGAGHLDPVRHPVASDRSGRHVTSALRHEEFRTSEPDGARRFFANAYTPGWWITGLAGGSAVTHRRCHARSITVDDVLIQGHARCEIPSGDSVVVIQPRSGSLTVSGTPLPNANWPVLVAHGMSCVLELNTARFDVVSITADVLRRTAADLCAPLPERIQFLTGRPRSRTRVRAWHRALDYVIATFASADTADQPLIAAAAAPLLSTALLECYPSNATAEHDLLSDPAVPEALKDAVSFIHRHAAGGVGINDVAAAVHLTPRAVQYLFRHRLDTTPTEYLRRVRLHRAHHDLMAGDHSSATVTEIAGRWGFAHTGRFAVLYRQTYGQSPHTTLRQ